MRIKTRFCKYVREFCSFSLLARHSTQLRAGLLILLPLPAPPVSEGDIPPDAVEHIIHHQSPTPRAKHWICNLPEATVRTLFLDDEPFRAAAAYTFDSITTVSGALPLDPAPAHRNVVLSITTDADHEKLRALIKTAGASLVSLEVLHSWQEPLSPSS